MRREDFERLYDEHAQPLYGFLLYRTGDRALSEDLLGDTFERVLRSRRRFDPRKGSETTCCTRSRSTHCATTLAEPTPSSAPSCALSRRFAARAKVRLLWTSWTSATPSPAPSPP